MPRELFIAQSRPFLQDQDQQAALVPKIPVSSRVIVCDVSRKLTFAKS